jgi:molybdopterin converting factor subunit 1
MKVSVRFFASLRDMVGADRLELDVAAAATPEDVWRVLVERHPVLGPRRASLAAAVNRHYARFEEPLREGDELAFIPPVSGG